MSLHRRLLILLAFSFGYNLLISQGGIEWEQATPICDPTSTNTFNPLPAIEDYDKTLYPSSIEPCNSYFSFNLNNPAWYTLQATSTSISMEISMQNCVGTGHGVGVQYALVEIIDDVPVPINCNSNANVGSNNIFSTDGLTIGTTYYLVLDGFAESVCEYNITNAVGFDDPEITESLSGLIVNDRAGATTGCRVNGVVKLSAVNAANNPIENANIYEWEISSTSGGSFSIIATSNSNSIELDNIPPGDYQAIVKPGNACDGTQASSTFSFTVDPNPIVAFPESTICSEDLSDTWDPPFPDYEGDPLSGLPENETRDTFYVEIPGGDCPVIQVLPLNFINGSNAIDPNNTIDTTFCTGTGVVINGVEYQPRAAGSLPQYVSLEGACSNTVELFVTRFFVSGEIIQDNCSTGGAVLTFESYLNNFEDVRQFASYEWFDEDGILVSQDETYQAVNSGFHSLGITLQKGNNPPCRFQVDPLFVDVSGLSDLEVECNDATSNSVSIQWNDLQDIDSYAVGVEGRIVEDDLRNSSYTYTNISLGETVNFFVFGINDDPNCPPLMDSISCQALDCPPSEFIIQNRIIPDTDSISLCLDESGDPVDFLAFEVSEMFFTATGRGRWVLSPNGILPPTDDLATILIDPNAQEPGEYVLSFRYQDGECRYISENERIIEIIRQPISTNLRRRGALDIDDGVCVNTRLTLDYNGRAGSNARAVWGGDLTNADVTGSMPGPFDITFTTPGIKNFTFMVMDENGCDSEIAPYSIEVGEPLQPQTITCNATQAGMEYTWQDQDCVEEYQLFINGRFETRVTESNYTYTRAVFGNTYELEVEAISGCGCDEIDFVSANNCMYDFNECVGVDVEISASSDTLVCLVDGAASIIQIEETINNGAIDGTGQWSVDSGDAAISPDGLFDPVVAGLGMHEIKYSWLEGACVYADSLSIVVSDGSSTNFNIEVLNPVCFGESIGEISVLPTGGSGDYTTFINEDPLGTKESVFTLPSGSHTVIVIDSLTGCDTLGLFEIAAGPDSLMLFPADSYFVLDGDSLAVNLDPDFVSTIDMLEWTYNGEPICSDTDCGANFILNPTESGELCITAAYSDMCVYTECAMVEYFPEFKIYFPNVVTLSNSPNNAFNTTFKIGTSDESAIINQMLIYDRWGNNVFENNDESNAMEWDPTKSSRVLEIGVYAFLIELTKGDGMRIKRSGTITLIR